MLIKAESRYSEWLVEFQRNNLRKSFDSTFVIQTKPRLSDGIRKIVSHMENLILAAMLCSALTQQSFRKTSWIANYGTMKIDLITYLIRTEIWGSRTQRGPLYITAQRFIDQWGAAIGRNRVFVNFQVHFLFQGLNLKLFTVY